MTETNHDNILGNPNYRVLKRVAEHFEKNTSASGKIRHAMIIDLETMGLNSKEDAIIELGLLKFSYSRQDGIVDVLTTYNGLQDPQKPIPEQITKLTGITDDDVKGQKIDWDNIAALLDDCHLVLCHNSGFDRLFLENQTPEIIQDLFKAKPFACTLKDIDWSERGYESSKLDYLNFKMGYFYDGHRAITDCWATFNLLTHEPSAFDELTLNARKTETLICAERADFAKKDMLKERGYYWSDGSNQLPKCWHISVKNEQLEEECKFLDTMIYGREGATEKLTKFEINAYNRYSSRLTA